MRATVGLLVIGGVLLAASDDPVVNHFNQRVEEYVKLRKNAADKVPALKKKATPEEIEQRERALLEAIRNARPACESRRYICAGCRFAVPQDPDGRLRRRAAYRSEGERQRRKSQA